MERQARAASARLKSQIDWRIAGNQWRRGVNPEACAAVVRFGSRSRHQSCEFCPGLRWGSQLIASRAGSARPTAEGAYACGAGTREGPGDASGRHGLLWEPIHLNRRLQILLHLAPKAEHQNAGLLDKTGLAGRQLEGPVKRERVRRPSPSTYKNARWSKASTISYGNLGGSPAVYRFPCEPLTEGFAAY